MMSKNKKKIKKLVILKLKLIFVAGYKVFLGKGYTNLKH